MHFFYSFLLLLVVLSAYSECPQHALSSYSFDSTLITVYPDGSSAQLGVLAPVLPQNEVYRIIPPHNEVYKNVLPQNKALTLIEVLNLTLSGVFNYFLPPNGMFTIITANYQWFDNMKIAIKIGLNLGVKGFKYSISTLIHGGEKLG